MGKKNIETGSGVGSGVGLGVGSGVGAFPGYGSAMKSEWPPSNPDKKNQHDKNHYEKNRAVLARAPRILKDAKEAGVIPLRLVTLDRRYQGEPFAGLAACYGTISLAYEECETEGKTPTYSMVIRNRESQTMIEALSRLSVMAGEITGRGEQFGNTLEAASVSSVAQFNVCYQMKNYEKTGKHCYTVSEGLATLLALTELRGVKCEDMHLPHRCLYLQIPKSLGFKIYNAITGWHEVEGLYISEDDKDSGMNVGVHSMPEPDGGRCWRVCVVGAPNENSIHELDDALSYFTISLIEGWDLDKSLANLMLRITKNSELDPSLRIAFDETQKEWENIFRWAFNAIMYATTPDAEHDTIRANPDAESIWRRIQKLPQGSKKRDDLKTRLRALDPMNRTVLGKSVKLTPALRAMAEHKAKGNGKSPLVRTLVSGHWQRFATGAGRKDRTWKFRQPFWRGPDGAPVAESNEHQLG